MNFPQHALPDANLRAELSGHQHALDPYLSDGCQCSACVCWRAGKVYRAYAPWPLAPEDESL